MVKIESDKQSEKIEILTTQERIFQERKRDVLLLLQHLAESQDTTVKLILSRLYDLGVDNIVQYKIKFPLLKPLVRGTTTISKPVFLKIAFDWFRKNCPQLITDWLLEQVAFGNTAHTQSEIIEIEPTFLEAEQLKVKKLRSQVRNLTGLLILTIAIFGGSFAWLLYTTNFQSSSNIESANIQINNEI